jgi:hypothetical protein
MGSTGSGRFTDYPGSFGNNPKQGGESKENECEKAFRTELEDVDTSKYYDSNNHLPIINTVITIRFNGSRIVAMVENLEIGNLPTRFNYLLKCMNEYDYVGVVSNISSDPINSINIDVHPNM